MSFDAFKTLDPDMFAKVVDQAEAAKEERDAAGHSGGYEEGIPTAYLPEGNHKMRILADPTLQMYRMVRHFTLFNPFKRIMDPRFYKQEDGTYKCGDQEIDNDVIERVWELMNGLEYPRGSRTQCLFYALLLETDAEDDYWAPGTLYLVQGPARFEGAWMSQMAAMRKNSEIAPHIANSINPTVEGWAWDLKVVSGSQGSISITPTFMQNHPAPEIDEATYLPLSEQVVKDGFDMGDFQRLESMLLDWRVEDGVDEENTDDVPGEGDGQATADGEGSDTPAEQGAEKSTEGEAAKSAEAGAEKSEAKSDESRDDLAAAMSGGEEKSGEAKQEVKSEESKSESKDEETDETYGLTEQQIAMANAANVSLKEFAEMIKA